MYYSHAFVSLFFRSLSAPKASIRLSSINVFTMRDTCFFDISKDSDIFADVTSLCLAIKANTCSVLLAICSCFLLFSIAIC